MSLMVPANPGHEETETPADEHQAVVHAQVLGAEEVGGERGHQRQTAAVLPVGDTHGDEQEEDALGANDGRHQKQADGRNDAVQGIGVAPADLIGIHAGAHPARGVHQTAVGGQDPGICRKEGIALAVVASSRRHWR